MLALPRDYFPTPLFSRIVRTLGGRRRGRQSQVPWGGRRAAVPFFTFLCSWNRRVALSLSLSRTLKWDSLGSPPRSLAVTDFLHCSFVAPASLLPPPSNGIAVNLIALSRPSHTLLSVQIRMGRVEKKKAIFKKSNYLRKLVFLPLPRLHCLPFPSHLVTDSSM